MIDLNYELIIAIVEFTYESIVSIGANEEYISFVQEIMQFELGDQFSIENPPPSEVYSDGEDFYFQWYCVDPPANTRGAVLSDALHGVIQ